LPVYAKEGLRINEKIYQVNESEADTWLQIRYFQQTLTVGPSDSNNQSDAEEIQSTIARLTKNLQQGLRSILGVPEYVEAIDKLLVIPGLRADFQSTAFEIFRKARCIEVCLQAGCTQL
jgi:Protein of unknown function (DUF3723)